MNTEIQFSVVVPVHNSSESLKPLFERIKAVFNARNDRFEVIFVDDYSQDESWSIISELKKHFPKEVKAIKLGRNFGQHNATFCGFSFAEGQWIITMDDDLQNPPEEIPALIEVCEKTNCSVVYGIANKKNHSKVRNAGSKTLQKSSKLFYDNPGNGSSFRILSRDLIDQILQHDHNFVYIDELINWYTRSVYFIEVEHHKREHQSSGYSKVSLFRLVANIVLFYTNFPLRMIVYGGLTFSFFSFLVGLFFIYRKIVHEVPLGFTAQIVAIFFSTGLILLGLGIIGEYLSRIYLLQQKKPPYSIQKIIE